MPIDCGTFLRRSRLAGPDRTEGKHLQVHSAGGRRPWLGDTPASSLKETTRLRLRSQRHPCHVAVQLSTELVLEQRTRPCSAGSGRGGRDADLRFTCRLNGGRRRQQQPSCHRRRRTSDPAEAARADGGILGSGYPRKEFHQLRGSLTILSRRRRQVAVWCASCFLR